MADGFDQNEIIDFLANPLTHGGQAVERIDTHSAVKFFSRKSCLQTLAGFFQYPA